MQSGMLHSPQPQPNDDESNNSNSVYKRSCEAQRNHLPLLSGTYTRVPSLSSPVNFATSLTLYSVSVQLEFRVFVLHAPLA